MNEADTRANLIDPALKSAGWGDAEGSKILREFVIAPGRIEGHGKKRRGVSADYVLMYRNHQLAIVEAKSDELVGRHEFNRLQVDALAVKKLVDSVKTACHVRVSSRKPRRMLPCS